MEESFRHDSEGFGLDVSGEVYKFARELLLCEKKPYIGKIIPGKRNTAFSRLMLMCMILISGGGSGVNSPKKKERLNRAGFGSFLKLKEDRKNL